jgi:hypothetical protein
MANVQIKIPGVAGRIERRQAMLAQAVAQQFAIVTALPAAPQEIARKPSAGDLGKPLKPIGLA